MRDEIDPTTPAAAAPDKPIDRVEAARAAARLGPAPGARHRHYKGHPYRTVIPAIVEATLAPATVYLGTECDDVAWVRTLDDWNERVAVGEEVVPRFAPLPAEEPGGAAPCSAPHVAPWDVALDRVAGLSDQGRTRLLANLLWDVFGDLDASNQAVFRLDRDPGGDDARALVTSLRRAFWPDCYPVDDGGGAGEGAG